MSSTKEIRKELRDQFQKFEEDKARQKEIKVEIGRKRNIQHMMATNPNFDYEGSSSIPCIDASNPFPYVPPFLESIQKKGKGAMRDEGTIKKNFTPSSPSDSAHGPSPTSRGQV